MEVKNMQTIKEQKDPFHMTWAEQHADGGKAPKQCIHYHKIGHNDEKYSPLHPKLLQQNHVQAAPDEAHQKNCMFERRGC